MSRANLKPVVIFKPKQTTRWNVEFVAQSQVGDFSFDLQAVNPPLLGFPKYRGSVRRESQVIASIASENQQARILTIRGTATPLRITVEKVPRTYGESDIVFEEDAYGDLAFISRGGEDSTLIEELKSLFAFGPRGPYRLCGPFGPGKRGAFKDLSPIPLPRETFDSCLLTAICLYLYWLEPLFNTEDSIG